MAYWRRSKNRSTKTLRSGKKTVAKRKVGYKNYTDSGLRRKHTRTKSVKPFWAWW